MRFTQVAIVLAASGFIGCKPAGPDAGTSPAASADSAATHAGLANAGKSGCRTRPRVAGTGSTDVQICALPSANKHSGTTAPAGGIIVATLTNIGTVRDDRWKLAPGTTYYLRVFPPRAGYTENGHYDIRSFTGETWDALPSPKASGSFVACTGPGHVKQPRSHAGYSICSAGPVTDPEDPLALTGSILPSDGPAWITCAEGCCTTDAT